MTDQGEVTEAVRTATQIAGSSFAVQLPFDGTAFWNGFSGVLRAFRSESRAQAAPSGMRLASFGSASDS